MVQNNLWLQLAFQQSYFKPSLWFGCIKTTQNNTGTCWEPEYVSGTSGRNWSLPVHPGRRLERKIEKVTFFHDPFVPFPPQSKASRDTGPASPWPRAPGRGATWEEAPARRGRGPLGRSLRWASATGGKRWGASRAASQSAWASADSP